jgi:hypothetical protein
MIRLTLLLTAGLIGTMLIFGTEDSSLDSASIEQRVLPDSESAVVPEVVSTQIRPVLAADPKPVLVQQPLAETQVESILEVTKLDSLDLNSILPSNDPSVVETNDTPPDSSLPVPAPELTVEPSKLLFVTGSRVNLRAGPSTGQAVVTQLGLGDRAELLGNTADGWVQIRHVQSGRIGYMSADFLSPVEPG